MCDVERYRAVPTATFIVRVVRDGSADALSGVVERARTGEKRRFRGAAGIGEMIERMLPPATAGRARRRERRRGR